MKRSRVLADLDAGTETLAEFVEEWWLVYAGPNLERSTLRVYAQLWNGHALPRLGQLRLRDVTPHMVARFRAELEAAGVGVEAIRKTMTMLQGVMQRAVECGRVPSNAVKLTRKPPKPHRPAVQAIPPSLIEVIRATLLAESRLRDATLLVVLGYAGMRPQEALALEWRHARERTLLVERALSDGQLKALKNRRQPGRSSCSLRCGRISTHGGAQPVLRRRRRSSRRAPAASGAQRTGGTGATSRPLRRSGSTARGRTTCDMHSPRCSSTRAGSRSSRSPSSSATTRPCASTPTVT